jgi:hypothetical protein
LANLSIALLPKLFEGVLIMVCECAECGHPETKHRNERGCKICPCRKFEGITLQIRYERLDEKRERTRLESHQRYISQDHKPAVFDPKHCGEAGWRHDPRYESEIKHSDRYDPRVGEVLNPSDKKFKCELCPMGFYSKRLLNAHRWFVHHLSKAEQAA